MSPTTGSSSVAAQQHRKIVKRYLQALDGHSRPADLDILRADIERVTDEIEDLRSVERVMAIQRKLDLEHRLAVAERDHTDFELLQADFIEIGAGWALRHEVTYAALRAMNVPVEVLAAAGLAP